MLTQHHLFIFLFIVSNKKYIKIKIFIKINLKLKKKLIYYKETQNFVKYL